MELNQIHVDNIVKKIRDDLEKFVQEPSEPPTEHARLNCTFHFREGLSDVEIAEWILSRMQHNAFGIEGRIEVNDEEKKCYIKFQHTEPVIEREFTFRSLGEFVENAIKAGVGADTIGSIASEICDRTTATVDWY